MSSSRACYFTCMHVYLSLTVHLAICLVGRPTPRMLTRKNKSRIGNTSTTDGSVHVRTCKKEQQATIWERNFLSVKKVSLAVLRPTAHKYIYT